jgi:hypothetical protein
MCKRLYESERESAISTILISSRKLRRHLSNFQIAGRRILWTEYTLLVAWFENQAKARTWSPQDANCVPIDLINAFRSFHGCRGGRVFAGHGGVEMKENKDIC